MSGPRTALLVLALLAPLGGCATVSVYGGAPTTAEVSLTAQQSELHKAADAYCDDARKRGLATGETSIGTLTAMLTGKGPDGSAYSRKIQADKAAVPGVIAHIRADLGQTTDGLGKLDGMARKVMAGPTPSKDDVTEFERALIHARQARDSLSDAIMTVNKRSPQPLEVADELAPLDKAISKATATADDLAAAKVDNPAVAGASATKTS